VFKLSQEGDVLVSRIKSHENVMLRSMQSLGLGIDEADVNIPIGTVMIDLGEFSSRSWRERKVARHLNSNGKNLLRLPQPTTFPGPGRGSRKEQFRGMHKGLEEETEEEGKERKDKRE
jgi:hypothetical protein